MHVFAANKVSSNTNLAAFRLGSLCPTIPKMKVDCLDQLASDRQYAHTVIVQHLLKAISTKQSLSLLIVSSLLEEVFIKVIIILATFLEDDNVLL